MAAKRETRTEDINEEVISKHNDLVDHLSVHMVEDDFQSLINLFKDCPLTPKDLINITTVQELFVKLKKNENISIGHYEYFTERLEKIDKSLASYVRREEQGIKDILNAGRSPTKRLRTEQECIQQSNSDSNINPVGAERVSQLMESFISAAVPGHTESCTPSENTGAIAIPEISSGAVANPTTVNQVTINYNDLREYKDEFNIETMKVRHAENLSIGEQTVLPPVAINYNDLREYKDEFNIETMIVRHAENLSIVEQTVLPPGGPPVVDRSAASSSHSQNAEQFTAVVQENDMKAFMSLEDIFVKAYPHEEYPWRLLHIVAVYGTAEMVDCIHGWTRIDWDRQHTIHEDLFKLALKSPNFKEATALYLATFHDRKDIVKSLVKLSGEDNIQLCLKELPISNGMEQIYMLELADRLRQKHADLKPTIVPGHQHEDNGTKSRVFIVYSVSVVKGDEYDFNGFGVVKLRNPYVIKRTKSVAHESETSVTNEDADTVPDEGEELSNAHVEKSPDDDAESSNEDVERLSNEDAKRVTEAIQIHRDRLWQTHSNLNIITGRRVKRNINGFDIHEACVVLYCSTKSVIPLGEDEFPKKCSIQNGDYVNVVVREGFFDFGGYATASGTCRHDYLKMGCEIGRSTPQFDTRGKSIRNGGGTLGPFVRFNNDLGFLTCAHVLFDIPSHSNSIDFTSAFSMVQVVQPSQNSTASVNATECGVVERAVFDPSRSISIDATVVKITDQSRKPTAGRFSNERHNTYVDAGFNELPEYNNGFMLSNAQLNALQPKPNVVKFGSRTDVTEGALGKVGADVRAYSKALGFGDGAVKVWMENQYLVTGIPPSTDFFDRGDSGSAVFCQDGNGQLVCVGMAIGYCVLDDYPYKAGIVTPIDAILQAIGPNFKLATFP